MAYINWKDRGNPFQDFTEELTYEWMRNGFDGKQTKEWLKIGLRSSDADFAYWLKNIKGYTTYWISKFGDKKMLRERHKKYIKNSELSKKVIEQLEGLEKKYFSGSYWHNQVYDELPLEQKTLIDKLIPNQKLKDKYNNYGLCKECKRINAGHVWCQFCNSQHFQNNFKNWTSGNQEIDEFIQEYQLKATRYDKVLEWIPYEDFEDVKYLAQGGFGKVYKAKWAEGIIQKWSTKHNKWKRIEKEKKEVALKKLNNSQNITNSFLQEIANHKLFESVYGGNIVECYGISQDSETKDYIIVMDCMKGSNLREYSNYSNYLNFEIDFKGKTHQLWTIAHGLKRIHEKGLVHRDFHSGNILNQHEYRLSRICHITDLGLCRPVGKEDKKEEIYGVLPYVSPEVLRGQPYTQASDVYSFGIMAYELFSCRSPYYEYAHDEFLAIKICQGLRPNLSEEKIIPQVLKELIEKCWDADPSKRPTTNELEKISSSLGIEFQERNTEFYRQFERAKIQEFNEFKTWLKADKRREQGLEEWDSFLLGVEWGRNYNKWNEWEDYDSHLFPFQYWLIIKKWEFIRFSSQTHPQAIYTSSLLNFKNLPEPQNSQEINEVFYKVVDDLEDLRIRDTVKFSDELKKQLQEQESQLKSIEVSENWTNIHPNFTPQLIFSWQNLNFTYQQTQDWISIGLKETDHHFASWLRDTKNLTPEQVLNHGNLEQLSQEFLTDWQQTQIEQPPK